MERIYIAILLLVVLLPVGCGKEAVVQPGENGGACRIGPEACAEGLACFDGRCQTPVEMEPRLDLDISILIGDRYLPADGMSSSVLLIEANDRESGDAFEGQLLLFESPLGAGRLQPRLIEFIDGLAQSTYTSCRAGGASECPEFIFIYAADPTLPLEPLARSRAIQLVNEANTFESAVSSETCGMGTNQVAFRSDQSVASETLVNLTGDYLTVRPEEGVLAINANGSQVNLRFDPLDTSIGTRILRAADISVNPKESLELPTPCNDPVSGAWNGTLDVQLLEVSEAEQELAALRVFFDLSCTADGNRTVTARGCASTGAQE